MQVSVHANPAKPNGAAIHAPAVQIDFAPANDMSLSQAAAFYARHGVPIIPLKPDSKVPRNRDWPRARWSEQAAIEHWSRFPNDNIGAICGVAEDGFLPFIVFDLDVKCGKQGEASWRMIEGASTLGLDSGPVQRTPSNGRHILARPHRKAGNLSDAGPQRGIDVLVHNKMIVVAPSTVEGKSYRWERSGTLPTAPDDIIEALATREPHSAVGSTHANATQPGFALRKVDLDSLGLPDHLNAGIRDADGEAFARARGDDPARFMDRSTLIAAVATELFLHGLDRDTFLSVLSDPGNLISQKPWEERGSRQGAAAWLDKYQWQELVAKFGSRDTAATEFAPFAAGSTGDRGAPTPLPAPLDWPALEALEPPPRQWVLEPWIPLDSITLLAGEGGVGKTLLAQHVATAIATGGSYFGVRSTPLRVLMWLGEDDHNEVWRRQRRINAQLGVSMNELGNLTVVSFDGHDMTLVWFDARTGRAQAMPLLSQLTEQVRATGAQLLVLDTVSRVFSGNENDRGHVVRFLTALRGAMPHPVAILLLAHPAKAQNSEYSGSTAWNGCVRTRLFLSRQAPGQRVNNEPDNLAANESRLRYLSRGKANYADLDYMAFEYSQTAHVLVPIGTGNQGDFATMRRRQARDVVVTGIIELQRLGKGTATDSAQSNSRYLPKMLRAAGLHGDSSDSEIMAAVAELMREGTVELRPEGVNRNGRERKGLHVVSPKDAIFD